jgi:hypothetical protein
VNSIVKASHVPHKMMGILEGLFRELGETFAANHLVQAKEIMDGKEYCGRSYEISPSYVYCYDRRSNSTSLACVS